MATTPVYSWPLPDLPDAPNVPFDMSALAVAIETVPTGTTWSGNPTITNNSSATLTYTAGSGKGRTSWCNPGTGIFTAPAAGMYLVGAQAAFSCTGSANGLGILRIYLGATPVAVDRLSLTTGDIGFDPNLYLQVAAVVAMTAGQQASATLYQGGGISGAITCGASFLRVGGV